MDKQKILDALKLIKDTCNNCEECEDCPFFCQNICMFATDCPPEDWELNNTKDIWRAFTRIKIRR